MLQPDINFYGVNLTLQTIFKTLKNEKNLSLDKRILAQVFIYCSVHGF